MPATNENTERESTDHKKTTSCKSHSVQAQLSIYLKFVSGTSLHSMSSAKAINTY